MNFKQTLVMAAISLVALFDSGCASMTKNKDDAALGSIKTVALAAYTVNYPMPAELGFNLGSGKVEGSRGGGLGSDMTEHTDPLFEEIPKSIQQKLAWNVLDVDRMRSHAAYRKAYQDTMVGWQTKSMVGEGRQKNLVAGVMDADSLRTLKFEGREALIKSLGVDAIVLANAWVSLEGTVVMGIGTRYPQTQITFFVYKKGIEAPVWFETFKGKPASESIGKTGRWDSEKMRALAIPSAKDALAQLSL